MDKPEEKALSDIDKYGCHILNVLEENEYPAFSYSIGIEQSMNCPELVVVGLKREIAQWLINEYNARIRKGEIFEPGNYYSDFLEGFEVTFKEVERKHYPEYFGWAKWLYKSDNFRVFQLVYPNTSGVWPWDPEADEEFKQHAPRLYAI